MTRSVKVSVAGYELAVRTDATPAYVQELARFVTAKMEEARTSGRKVTTQSLALLAAMNIADELYALRQNQTRLKQRVKEASERILCSLDRVAEP